MIFHAFSVAALKSLEKFEKYYQHSLDRLDRVVLEKIKQSGFQVLLVASDELVLGEGQPAFIDKNNLFLLSNAWRTICGTTSRQQAVQRKSWQVIDGVGTSIPFRLPSTSLYVRRLSQHQDDDIFFILLTEDEPKGLPAFELIMLSNLWQLKQGFFLLHTAGVQHNGNLFLFNGPSGAGKSTVAAISYAVGDQVIDEDQVLVHSLPAGGFSANGWGYGIVPCKTPLRAIFRLVQDSEDRLIPLNQLQVAQLVLGAHSEIMGGMLFGDLLKRSFHLASEIARHVPGFELHFRKSPDFWKLIDAEFPLE
jgi:hypothetical protein